MPYFNCKFKKSLCWCHSNTISRMFWSLTDKWPPHFSICANSATLKASVIHKPHKPYSICVYFAICRVQHFYDHQSVRQCRQRNSMCLTFLKPNNTIIVSNSCWIPVKSLQISIYPWFVILFDFFSTFTEEKEILFLHDFRNGTTF